ncbi:MAG: hypothetical protein GY871_04325 [Actinomycetales bacterium]|nr:hypothetical protein [Actinomycetales bacterium]
MDDDDFVEGPEPEDWHPERADWPKYGPDRRGRRLYAPEALALLILEEAVVPLAAVTQSSGDYVVGLYAMCNDAFDYACADAEPLPQIGFSDDLEAPFWDLYDAFREHGWSGLIRWVALRRNRRPLKPHEDRLKTAGLWDERMEALER